MEAARAKRDQRPPEEEDTCTMCGNYCAVKIVNEWLDQSDSDLIKQMDFHLYFTFFNSLNIDTLIFQSDSKDICSPKLYLQKTGHPSLMLNNYYNRC